MTNGPNLGPGMSDAPPRKPENPSCILTAGSGGVNKQEMRQVSPPADAPRWLGEEVRGGRGALFANSSRKKKDGTTGRRRQHEVGNLVTSCWSMTLACWSGSFEVAQERGRRANRVVALQGRYSQSQTNKKTRSRFQSSAANTGLIMRNIHKISGPRLEHVTFDTRLEAVQRWSG